MRAQQRAQQRAEAELERAVAEERAAEEHARMVAQREYEAMISGPDVYARDAIEEFETLSPVEILQRHMDQHAEDNENMGASPDESQNSNPSSTVITSYPRTLPGSPFSIEEPPSHTEGETIGTIAVSPISSYSDVEYSNSSEHPNRTITITECTDSVGNENETSPRPSGPSFPRDDNAPR